MMNEPLGPAGGVTDTRRLREVLGCFPTGVAVVTTLGANGGPVGLTVNSLASVSLDPPLLLWCLSLASPSLPAFRTHPCFAVNILATDQGELCRRFARPSADRFAGVRWRPGLHGVPLIDDAVAHLQCRPYVRHGGGDHEIIVGEVVALAGSDRAPLVFSRGRLTGVSGA